jgi:ferric-dicitrate binding protein FerR (iron transport regulator)
VDDIREGTVTKEGNTNVTKIANDQLVYSGSATTGTWNTLTVPKGSKPFRVTLSDGSHVTVNVASSITYPTVFSGNSRNVTMTGEAYFEIAKRPSLSGSGNLPFIVAMNGASVEVKGTKFNVNAYEDEGVVKTTLVEGTVNILAGHQRRSIAPGEQAIVMPDLSKEIELEKEADIDEATAWMNDKFRFHEADLQTVMRQVARWYDVEIKYAAKPKLRFGGQIDRSSTLREMFAILETSGVHFSLSGNVVTVLP